MDTNFSSMLYDADFTLMLSTLDNHDVEMLSDTNFTLMLPILDGDAQGC